jgi:hypothetical protein
MSLRNEGVSSVRQRMRRVSQPLVDMGLGLLVAVAVIIAIGPAAEPRPTSRRARLRAGAHDRRVGVSPAALAGGGAGRLGATL